MVCKINEEDLRKGYGFVRVIAPHRPGVKPPLWRIRRDCDSQCLCGQSVPHSLLENCGQTEEADINNACLQEAIKLNLFG